MNKVYSCKGRVWKDPKANWYFVGLDKKLSKKIKAEVDTKANKYGLIKVKIATGKTIWDSTLFPTKNGDYVFAIKSTVRKKEKIEDGDELNFKIEL